MLRPLKRRIGSRHILTLRNLDSTLWPVTSFVTSEADRTLAILDDAFGICLGITLFLVLCMIPTTNTVAQPVPSLHSRPLSTIWTLEVSLQGDIALNGRYAPDEQQIESLAFEMNSGASLDEVRLILRADEIECNTKVLHIVNVLRDIGISKIAIVPSSY